MTELIAMDVERLERYLRERREALREILRAAQAATREQRDAEPAGAVHDTGDESVADLLLAVDIAGHERELEELRGVEAALGRIANNQFGVCIACHGDIDRDRLLIFPAAKRCFRCQQLHEFRRAGGADISPSL